MGMHKAHFRVFSFLSQLSGVENSLKGGDDDTQEDSNILPLFHVGIPSSDGMALAYGSSLTLPGPCWGRGSPLCGQKIFYLFLFLRNMSMVLDSKYTKTDYAPLR